MRPVFAAIPALPASWFLPLILVAFAAGGGIAWRFKSYIPLLVAVGVAFLGWMWTRQGITIHSYGLFLVLGFFASTWLACLEAKRRGYDPNIVLDMAMPLLLVSILLCRVLYFLIYPSQWHGFGEFLKIWNGGLSFHGAIVGAIGTLAYFSWSRKIPFGTLGDFIAPGAFLGYAIGRIGCFMNGCCYGHETALPWGVRFPDETNRAIITEPCHPAQLYSTFMGLAIFAVLWKLRTKPNLNRFPGQLTLLMFGFYAVERFIMEIFRNGATAPLAFGLEWLTKAQLASVLGLVVIAALWIYFSRRPVPHSENSSALDTKSTHVSTG